MDFFIKKLSKRKKRKGKDCPFARKAVKPKGDRVVTVWMCIAYVPNFELSKDFKECENCTVEEYILNNPGVCKHFAPLDFKGKNGTTRYYCKLLKRKDVKLETCTPRFCSHYEQRPRDMIGF